MGATEQSFAAMAIVLFLPLIAAVVFRRQQSADGIDSFLTNAGANGFWATVAGAVSGNIGIGTFLALFLFTKQSPVIGFAIVGAYTSGLFLCAALAPTIRRTGERYGTVGLIDLIVSTHGVRYPLLIWLPVALVFVLRSAVHLGALGYITASLFGGHVAIAIAAAALLVGTYLQIGGYRAAVGTDKIQATIIVIGVLICAFSLPTLEGEARTFFDLGTYQPTILVGICLFLPFSAVLAIDNWQRLVVAKSDRVAQTGFATSAIINGGVYTVAALAGYWASDDADMYATYQLLAPSFAPWIPAVIFIACIMSSIDTFIMPLVSAFGPKTGMKRLRLLIAALICATAVTAIIFGDTLATVIAAFSSLTVFLPAAFGALYLAKNHALAAIVSFNAGLLTAVGFTFVDDNIAALIGFGVSALSYVAITYFRSRENE